MHARDGFHSLGKDPENNTRPDEIALHGVAAQCPTLQNTTKISLSFARYEKSEAIKSSQTGSLAHPLDAHPLFMYAQYGAIYGCSPGHPKACRPVGESGSTGAALERERSPSCRRLRHPSSLQADNDNERRLLWLRRERFRTVETLVRRVSVCTTVPGEVTSCAPMHFNGTCS